ncbi:MAG: hypothetical protein ACFFED_14375 [Candidatus Thorarchaeota archaeon]
MNGKHILLMLAHLFRKYGSIITIEDAVHALSFQWRYGNPTKVRKILSLAKQQEMISVMEGRIRAEFLFDSQSLEPNQAMILSRQDFTNHEVDPLF